MCVCVSSVHCSSKEWETSEYSNSLCVNLDPGWMLHVTFYSGSVVMMLCISQCQASSVLLRIFTHWPKVMSAMDSEGLPWPSHTVSAWFSFPLQSYMFKLLPFLLLSMWNMNLILLFIAFVCLKNKLTNNKERTPCSSLTMSLKSLKTRAFFNWDKSVYQDCKAHVDICWP